MHILNRKCFKFFFYINSFMSNKIRQTLNWMLNPINQFVQLYSYRSIKRKKKKKEREIIQPFCLTEKIGMIKNALIQHKNRIENNWKRSANTTLISRNKNRLHHSIPYSHGYICICSHIDRQCGKVLGVGENRYCCSTFPWAVR